MRSEEMSTEFWDAINKGKLILRYSRVATEGEKKTPNKMPTKKPQTDQKAVLSRHLSLTSMVALMFQIGITRK